MSEKKEKKSKSPIRLFQRASSNALYVGKLGLEKSIGKGTYVPLRSSFIRNAETQSQSRLAKVIGAGSRLNGAGKGGRNTAGKGGGEVRLKLLLSLILQNPRGWTKEAKQLENRRFPAPRALSVNGLAYADLFALYRSRVKEGRDLLGRPTIEGAEPVSGEKDYQGAKRVTVALNWLEENKFVRVEGSRDLKDRMKAYEEDKAKYDSSDDRNEKERDYEIAMAEYEIAMAEYEIAMAEYDKNVKGAKEDVGKPIRPRQPRRPGPPRPRGSRGSKEIYLLREGADSFSTDDHYVRPQKKRVMVDDKEVDEQEPYIKLPIGLWRNGWIGVLPAAALAVLLCLIDFSKKVNRTERLRVRADTEESYSLSTETWRKGSACLWAYDLIDIDEDATPIWAGEYKAPVVYTINSKRLEDSVGLRAEVRDYLVGNSNSKVLTKRGYKFELAPGEKEEGSPFG